MQEQDQNILAVNEQSINNKIDEKIKKSKKDLQNRRESYIIAKCSKELYFDGIDQWVEHFTRNEGVVGSSPISSFSKKLDFTRKIEC